MAKLRRKTLLLITLGSFTIVSLTIASICEVVSRRYHDFCQPYAAARTAERLSCHELGAKYGSPGRKPPDLLFEVITRRETKQPISGEEYRQLAETLVLEVERKDIGGNNGLACGYWGYVAEDLSEEAKKFVRRHELVHLLGEGNELRANLEAGLEYPLGLVQTAITSVWRIVQTPNYPIVCKINLLWERFKMYFLP